MKIKTVIALLVVSTQTNAGWFEDTYDSYMNPEKFCVSEGERHLSSWVAEQEKLDMEDFYDIQKSVRLLLGVLSNRDLDGCSPLYVTEWEEVRRVTQEFADAATQFEPIYEITSTKETLEELSPAERKDVQSWSPIISRFTESTDRFKKAMADARSVLMPNTW